MRKNERWRDTLLVSYKCAFVAHQI
jgi:hypothetical protein